LDHLWRLWLLLQLSSFAITLLLLANSVTFDATHSVLMFLSACGGGGHDLRGQA
jgi:hypothetical protein